MTTKFVHLRYCYDARRRWKKEVREFEKKFPNYCRRCGGVGGFIYRYDPSPKGIALSPGWMEDFETCEDCIEKDKCPRCREKIIWDTSGRYEDHYRCPTCGWNDLKLEEGLPEEPECCCDEVRTYRKEKKHANH
jgi:hypothetical protein